MRGATHFEQKILLQLFKDEERTLETLEPLTSSERAKYACMRLKRLQDELDTAKLNLRRYREDGNPQGNLF